MSACKKGDGWRAEREQEEPGSEQRAVDGKVATRLGEHIVS